MDKDMMLEATDIVRTVASRQKGLKRFVGKILNLLCGSYYTWI